MSDLKLFKTAAGPVAELSGGAVASGGRDVGAAGQILLGRQP